ncbi:hypothetical protein BSKO_09813 [Bryopsis sp. KO-2023]|nr:hypothetical protein BSKO_09813 [Bryopsis sp. KO-2023]
MRRSFWTTWFGKTRERFSLEELEYLYSVLEKTPEITATNRDQMVETLRSIAELIIWGDQHEPKFFEFFLEKNVLGHFHKILTVGDNRRGDVAKQVLQTLSIMIQNLRSETSVFYLFSKDHINDIVQLRFDFEDEEVLGLYISFLKTISLKLNPKTVQFFFQDNGAVCAFPLYTEAIRFINHKEGMVRAAVRTLTLNVYRVTESVVQDFVVAKPASNYFTELALYAAEQCQIMDRMLSNAESGSSQSAGPLDSQLAEIEDMISYFNDIFLTGSDLLGKELAKSLWECFVSPILLWPLLDVSQNLSPKLVPMKSTKLANGGEAPAPGVSLNLHNTQSVRPVCALYVLERLFHLMEHPLLANAAASCLLAGDQSGTVACGRCTGDDLRPKVPESWKLNEVKESEDSNEKDRVNSQFDASTSSECSGVSPFAAPAVESGKGHKTRRNSTTESDLYVKYREAFSLCFTGGNCQLGAAAVRVLVALIDNPSVDPDLLDIVGVLPHRRRIRRDLLLRLAGSLDLDEEGFQSGKSGGSSRPSVSHIRGSLGSIGSFGSDEFFRLPRLPETQAKEFKDRLSDERLKHLSISSMESLSNGNMSPQGSLSSELSAKYSASPRTKNLVDELMDGVVGQAIEPDLMEMSPLQEKDISSTPATTEIISALCQLLLLPMLPAPTVWQVAWLLNQLMPSSNKGLEGRAVDNQLEMLKGANESSRNGVLDELRGMWCDALLPLIHLEWPKARQGMLQPSLESTSRAVLAWIHAQQSHELGMELASQEGVVSHQVARRKGLSLSAQAAVHVHHKVRRMVAMLQMHQLLNEGTVPEICGLPSVTEADLASSEVRESCEVDLGESEAIRCTVAFSRGRERSVFFSVYGVPWTTSTSKSERPATPPSPQISLEDMSKLVPVVILAAPAASSLNAGMVLSVAPLLGTDPAVDGTHPRWLHLHVRPSVRRFVKAVQACDQWNRSLIKSWQPLVDGHWVLSFQDGDHANNAKLMVQQHAAKITALYCDVLTPLLSPEMT